jgi:hypothetical protein
VFAKQVSITSLLICIYISVYMKFPKEGDKDNEVAEFIKSIPWFSNLTINEIAVILMSFYSNLFHLISSLSRRIDTNPVEQMKTNYQKFMKKTFTTHYLCEFLHARISPPEPEPLLV